MTELTCWPLDNKEYTAEALGAAYAARSRGILHAADFTATANGDNTLTIGPGVGCIHPGTYWAAFPYLLANTQLTFTDADGTNPRWDAVALTYDKNTNTAGLEVRTGTASASPALPELRRNDDYDEIFLYRVTRPRGATKISADNIVDLRLDSTCCGLMRDTMDSVDTGVMNAAFTAFLQQIETELAQLHAGTAVMTKGEYDPAGLSLDAAVQLYSCTKSGKVYALKGTGAVGRFKVPAAWSAGDTWTVNGKAVPAYCGADAADGDSVVAGRWVLFTFDGSRLDFNGGGGLSASKLAQATAADTDVLTGKKYYAGDKTIKEGKMPNRGAISESIYPGGSYTIPAGYHNGNGKVTAKRSYTTVYLGQQTAYWTNFTYDVKSHYGSIYDKLSRSNFYTVPYAWSGNCIEQAASGNGACADYVSYNANTGMLTVGAQSYGQAGVFISNVLFKVYMIY
jgi:hypothetical protein